MTELTKCQEEEIKKALGEKERGEVAEYKFGDAGMKSLKQAEDELINKTLKFYNGNVAKAAESLGLSMATLYRKLSEQKVENNGI